MAAVTKTIGPLHLEDLEPHRFEDLVRQLLYDFRPWRDLEATGRSGSDEGFDIRAWESTIPAGDGDDAEEQDDPQDASTARQWLIQCKREKAIAPSKLKGYLNELPDVKGEGLYGIVFVAACDFSKAARDIFYEETRKLGFMEIKLWGKAEVEDQLFQPKNDHLLFAYFGISLQVRQRTLKTTVRARLSRKRQAKKILTLLSPVLIRDASDERYPYPDPDKSLTLIARRRWKVLQCEECHHDGIWFSVFRAPAYIADDGKSWDYAEGTGQVNVDRFQDPWRTTESEHEEELQQAIYAAAMKKWETLDSNRAWLEQFLVLPYDNILAIDETGDDCFDGPHIYVARFDGKAAPFLPGVSTKLETIDRYSPRRCRADPEKRVQIFDRKTFSDK
jgi:hypothetical protein